MPFLFVKTSNLYILCVFNIFSAKVYQEYVPFKCNVFERLCASQALVSFKQYMPPLLQGKYLPFSPSPLRLKMFRLFVILSLTQIYRYTPEIFLFSTATFKYLGLTIFSTAFCYALVEIGHLWLTISSTSFCYASVKIGHLWLTISTTAFCYALVEIEHLWLTISSTFFCYASAKIGHLVNNLFHLLLLCFS